MPAAQAALSVFAPAVAERAQGRRPSRTKSLLTAGTIGVTAAFVTYRLLRSGGSEEDEEA
jgi:hypothetical protein